MKINNFFLILIYSLIAFSLFYLTGHNFEKIVFPKLLLRLGFASGIENSTLITIGKINITAGSIYPIIRIFLITALAYIALYLITGSEQNRFYYPNIYLSITLFIFIISILAKIIAPDYDFELDKVKFLIRSPILLCILLFIYKAKLFKNLT